MSAYQDIVRPESLDETLRERDARILAAYGGEEYAPVQPITREEAMRNMLEARLEQALAERKALESGKPLPPERLEGIDAIRARAEQREKEEADRRAKERADHATEMRAASEMAFAWRNERGCRVYRDLIARWSTCLSPYRDSIEAEIPRYEEGAVLAMVEHVSTAMAGVFTTERLRREAMAFVARFRSPLDASGGQLPAFAGDTQPTIGANIGSAQRHTVESAMAWADIPSADHQRRQAEERERARMLGVQRASGYGALAAHRPAWER